MEKGTIPKDSMIKEFESSYFKIRMAEKDILNLDREVAAFLNEKPWTRVVEPDVDVPEHLVHKIKLTRELPESIPDLISNVTCKLRAALDHAYFAIAKVTPRPDGKTIHVGYFPISSSPEDFKRAFDGWCKFFPHDLQAIILNLKPYRGGNRVLWALNKIAGSDKHALAIPIGIGSFQVGVDIHCTGYFSAPAHHEWDRAKNELEIVTVASDTKLKYKLGFRMFVAFDEIESVDGQPVVPILRKISSQVRQIIAMLEEASIRCRVFN